MSNGDDASDLLADVARKLPAGEAIAHASRLQIRAIKRLDKSINSFSATSTCQTGKQIGAIEMLDESINSFSATSTRQTRWLIGLTVALLVCTVALIGLTLMVYPPGN